MNKEQLSERIGNIDDRLVQQAEDIPNYQKQHRVRGFKRLAACAAALALMVTSFMTGMVVQARQGAAGTPVGDEIVELEDFSLSLIMPDNWKGRYGVERQGADSYAIYSTQTREAGDMDGILCYIVRWNEPLTEEEFKAGGEWDAAVSCDYISSTVDVTYLLYPATDVQYTKETLGLYLQMTSEIPNIRFVTCGEIPARLSVREEAFEGMVAAFIKDFSGDRITVDIIEYISELDTERIAELGLTEDDMLDGYYFNNPEEELTVWTCDKTASYTFIDWGGDFTGSPYPGFYCTMSLDEFHRYLDTYTDGLPWMPLFFTVEDGVIKSVLEKPFM